MKKRKKQKKKTKAKKLRNWQAVWAFLRPGAGKHKDRSKYNRKEKHKNKDENREQ